jgi:hypothetical protein
MFLFKQGTNFGLRRLFQGSLVIAKFTTLCCCSFFFKCWNIVGRVPEGFNKRWKEVAAVVFASSRGADLVVANKQKMNERIVL